MVVGHGTTDGVTIGPLIDERAVDKADEHVQDAIAHGARARRRRRAARAAASTRAARSTRRPCSTASPTEMLIYREETFGPVAGVTPFDDRGGGDPGRERHDLRPRRVLPHARLRAPPARRREARLRHRRREHRDHQAANAPFGGIKESGYGREGGSFGIDEYLDVKYVCVGGVGV